MDWDDLCIEYEELVESGEIDPDEETMEEFIEREMSESIDKAMDSIDMDR